MKITFVYPDVIGSANYGGIFYVGIGMLSSVLKAGGFSTSLMHITQPITKRAFQMRLAAEQADVFAFSSTTPMFSLVKIWSQWVKEYDHKVPIIVGGVHAILNPEEVFAEKAIDFVCVGEGEYALRELCQALASGSSTAAIAGVWSKQNGKVVKTARRPLIENLDELPFPDRELFCYPKLMDAREHMLFVMASRGCPYSCPYCCSESVRAIMGGKGQAWVRFRSPDHVIAELGALRKLYPQTRFIGFYDDILALDTDWFREFAVKYKEHVGLPFRCNMRANLMPRDIVQLLHEAGCRRIVLGVESGNEYVRNKILKRNMSEKVLLDAAKLCKEFGMELVTNNMIGLPGENARAVLDTVKINARMDVDITWTSIFYPFPQTELYMVAAGQGLLTTRIINDFVEGSTLKFDWLTVTRIVFVRNYFRPLMNLYKAIYRLPLGMREAAERCVDGILTSPLVFAAVFPLGNWLFRVVRENKVLAALVNRCKHYR